MNSKVWLLLCGILLCIVPSPGGAEPVSTGAAAATGHADPVVPVLINLVVILIAAKVGGDLFERIGQPSVLGELVFGVVLGNLAIVGITVLAGLRADPIIDIFARLGVILLLFEVGLETNIKKMMQVGVPSFLVAVCGVIVPFVLGSVVSLWHAPSAGLNTHIFIGAILTATSVGITARVLKDLDRLHLPEAQIILGAAVIDDVLGLIILAIVSGMVTMGSVSAASVALISLKAVGFLALALLIGIRFAAPWLGQIAQRMRVSGAVLAAALVFCFMLSTLADSIGLATIVGAFAAGLILEDHHFRLARPPQAETVEGLALMDSAPLDDGARMMTVGTLLAPISTFLVPIFFVLMGIRVHLETFLDLSVLGMALALTLAAFVGKLVCGLAVRRSYRRLVISVGMVPRGEVGLIFATIGRGLGVMDDALFSAVVIMVIITTLVTPPLLTWSLGRGEPH